MPFAPPARLLATFLLCLCVAAPAAALELVAVRVTGVDDEAQHDDVLDALSLHRLNPNRRRALTESRLSYLLRRVPREARQALEPYGYYDTQVETEVVRDGDRITVRVAITPGEPVKVRRRELALTGAAETDTALTRRLQRLRPREGQVFDHATYETGKANMDRALAARGYFDARLDTHRVTVSRAEHAADIALAWDSGERYTLGEATLEGHPFRPGLLEHLVPWKPGQPYDQAELLALQASLAELDYFAAIDIRPRPDDAQDKQVPVTVALSPAKRSVYSAGVRFGTDSGLGLTGGLERRWVNSRGHKFESLLSLAQRRNDLATQYRIPAFKWLDGWYTAGAKLRQEEVDGINNELFELVGSRSGRLGNWNLLAALNYRRERFEDAATGFDYSYSTLVYPSLWAQWGESDDPLYPRAARGLTLELRAGSSAFGSDLDFLQVRAEGRWIRSFGRRHRLLLRAEAGTTMSGDFPSFPPSLRFYAGGDRSVRGYGYKEIGQYFLGTDGRRYVFGGKHLLVASAEFERMFTREWGAAVFVDAGDAFDGDGSFDPQVGAGLGLRWRSPVGPVRIDVAHGFGGDAQQSIRLHLNIGPDL
ncbi:autotransporter assembly complex family protein [Arenimonas sp.]|uniref:autotransporter assembly complex protein TamA n=1 Tax=Arenimonas sp. TaxID=1872635 RepID=UPI0035B0DF59